MHWKYLLLNLCFLHCCLMRKKNLLCTQILGPILPLNPLFCEYLLKLAGVETKAAYREAAMDAYEQHLKEFRDPKVVFGHNI